MRFLVLGAGYVGKAFLKGTLSSECVFAATTTSLQKIPELKSLAKEVYVVDGKDRDTLKKLLKDCDGIGIFIAPNAEQSYEECYLETAHAIASVLQERAKPFYLLYTSSTAVYQSHEEEWASEETSLHPTNYKAKILAEAEKIYLDCTTKNVKVCILRLAGIYGPGREVAKRAIRFAGKEMGGSGDEVTNHVHLNDVVTAIEFAIQHHLYGIFNIASDEHPTRKALYSELCSYLGLTPPVWNPQVPLEHGCGCKVSNQKIKAVGFVFSHPKIEYASD